MDNANNEAAETEQSLLEQRMLKQQQDKHLRIGQSALEHDSGPHPNASAHNAEPSAQDIAQQLRRLNEIGVALSAERDIESLLEMILSGSRELTGADAGTFFLVNDSDSRNKGDDAFYHCKAQNDSISVPINIQLQVSPSSLAGYVAVTGETLCFPDVYQLPPDTPYKFNPTFDRATGYRTKSVLVVPMKNLNGDVLGVLQLINRKARRDLILSDEQVVEREALPFAPELVDMAKSLASQAAVALENSRLVRKLQKLIDSLVRASGDTIEGRDPSTAGHSKRVTILTVALAEAASAARSGPFKDVHFSDSELLELQYAGWLHDFGKIGVRESVLTKSHKLEPTHFEVVKRGLALLRRQKENECAERKIAIWRDKDESDASALTKIVQIEADIEAELEELGRLQETLQTANDPSVTFLPDDEFARQQQALEQLSQMSYIDALGQRQPVLTPEEKQSLSIRKGSLTPDEYYQIQQHARFSYEFLREIAWTPEFENIPEIAHCHHEKLNGKGYPRGITAEQIPLQSKMMTIADIYDALTASDRPYKKSMPVERALHILRSEAAEGGLDAGLVELFISEKIYELTREGKQPGDKSRDDKPTADAEHAAVAAGN